MCAQLPEIACIDKMVDGFLAAELLLGSIATVIGEIPFVMDGKPINCYDSDRPISAMMNLLPIHPSVGFSHRDHTCLLALSSSTAPYSVRYFRFCFDRTTFSFDPVPAQSARSIAEPKSLGCPYLKVARREAPTDATHMPVAVAL